jgi:hypothetical protein
MTSSSAGAGLSPPIVTDSASSRLASKVPINPAPPVTMTLMLTAMSSPTRTNPKPGTVALEHFSDYRALAAAMFSVALPSKSLAPASPECAADSATHFFTCTSVIASVTRP